MAFWCAVLILVISIGTGHVQCQTDSLGFINIDCGLSSNSTSEDVSTGLTYVSDDQFIDTGVNYRVASQYTTSNTITTYLTLRSFPNGKKNCYTLRSLTSGSKYLIRGTFFYGNYDKLKKPPIFDLYLGVNYWETFMSTNYEDDIVRFTEIIAVATDDYMQVCLVNKGLGTPFISSLELRSLKSSIYELANSSQSLSLYERYNFGESQIVSYPDDPYDRYWVEYTSQDWKSISTTTTVKPTDKDFETPSLVLQTAVVPLKTTSSLDISWTSDDESKKFYVILHINEIQRISSTDLREFNIYANGGLLFDHVVPVTAFSDWYSYTHQNHPDYNVSLQSTSNATLPPILNAFELYIIRPISEVPTDIGDVSAINKIKANYKVDKGWNGDPCVPKNLTWIGVGCTSDSSGITRITGLNLSSSGLTGTMISAFGDLTALKKLDLSWNKLTGSMPSSLDQLTELTLLDISGNSLTLSPGLQKKQQTGALTVINSNSPLPCTSNCKKKNSSIIFIVIAAAAVVLVLIVAVVTTALCLRKRRKNHTNANIPTNQNPHGTPYNNAVNYVHNTNAQFPGTPCNNAVNYIHNPNAQFLGTPHNNDGNYVHNPNAQFPVQNNPGGNYPNTPQGGDGLNIFESQQFKYKELKTITNNFQNIIGAGGFGNVYAGRLENGTQVAVKMRSQSSSQGVKEFLAEAKNLTKVHHKHLVSLIGYCMDGDCMALVYEYMQEGTLQNKLRDNIRPLTWKQRLRIAHESAQGLDYLHKSCNPSVIHRDVKTSNILLNSNLEAKIADFGLSRAFNNDVTSISTRVVGTPGYLDPKYYNSHQLSEKSDVFSFGVVLLEIVTGQSPIIGSPAGGHISDWVNQRLSKGDIESIVDQRMRGQYDINSVWKVTTLAQKCTARSSVRRPTMNMIEMELRESLDLEISTEGTCTTNTTFRGQYTDQYNYLRNDNLVSDVSQNSVLEMAYMRVSVEAPGPNVR
ncbi:hypothetical protein LUZ60_000462 [Juncus effusus]|nr:hypothetical protein LUZ60_000462 [Juncus effusus]